jgi:hypothetical protein
VQVYTGIVSKGAKLAQLIRKEGWGVCLVPELLRRFCPSTFPKFFVDNGAFAYHKRGEPFKGELFLRTLEVVAESGSSPAFVVVPDIIEGGMLSLEFSLKWHERLKKEFPSFHWALVVQDGMEEEAVREVLSEFDVLFVGGSIEWKLWAGKRWVELAHSHGKWCHIGRVGTLTRLRWAWHIGADSIDSSLPLFSKKKLSAFLRTLRELSQPTLPFGGCFAV